MSRSETFDPPKQGISILEHVRGFLKADGSGLDPEGLDLPDEQPRDDSQIRFAPGAMDGAFGHHGGGGAKKDRAETLARLVLKCATKPTRRRLMKLYSALETEITLDYIDPLIESLVARKAAREGVARVGSWLVETGLSREPVKVGIALCGVAGISDPRPIRDLGSHDEFTLYAAVALGNGWPDPEPEIWSMAKSVDGWGRIHCVERLTSTTNPEIKEWILRDGFRNSIMYEYLAHIAATAGELNTALHREDIDRNLLDAAGEIIQALIMGGPAAGIDDYEHAADTIATYLTLMSTHAESLLDYLAVADIHRFLTTPTGWDRREAELGWSEETREHLRRLAGHLLARPEWEPRIREALESDDQVEFGRATQAAERGGMDTFDVFLARLQSDPLSQWWFHAWKQANATRAGKLVDLARARLDPETIASGPSTAIGMGPGFEKHQALGWTLQGLQSYPGVGGDLVLAALRSPSIQNRNGALDVLFSWPRAAWPEGTEAVLAIAKDLEPEEKIAARMDNALRGYVDPAETWNRAVGQLYRSAQPGLVTLVGRLQQTEAATGTYARSSDQDVTVWRGDWEDDITDRTLVRLSHHKTGFSVSLLGISSPIRHQNLSADEAANKAQELISALSET